MIREQINQNFQFMLQAYATTVFLVALHHSDFLGSEAYKSLIFQDKFIKEEVLPIIGIGNLGTFAMVLYALVVLPYETKLKIDKILGETHEAWVKNKKILDDEYAKINSLLGLCKRTITETTYCYKKHGDQTNFIFHFRNATSHGKLSHDVAKNVFEFKDVSQSKTFSTEIPSEIFLVKVLDPLLAANKGFIVGLKEIIDDLPLIVGK